MPLALITGVSGQDGHYLTDLLLKKRWDVHGTVLTSSDPRAAASSEVTLHNVDLSATASVRELVHQVRPDVIFNLAALSSVAQSWENPEATFSVNAMGAAALLEGAWQLKRSANKDVRFVQASSAEIFGRAEDVPQRESTRLQPITPYGASKAFAHQLIAIYRSRGLFASSAILYNHESPRRPETFVTRKITSQVARIALGSEERLRLGSLDVKRDWGWAPDYVDAMYRMAVHSHGDDFVVATGMSHTVGEFVERAFKAAGVSDWTDFVDVDTSFVRPADAPEMLGDSEKARSELAWSPTVDFDQLVRRMVEHDMERERLRVVLTNSEMER